MPSCKLAFFFTVPLGEMETCMGTWPLKTMRDVVQTQYGLPPHTGTFKWYSRGGMRNRSCHMLG